MPRRQIPPVAVRGLSASVPAGRHGGKRIGYSSCASHIQPAGKMVQPVGGGAFIKRGDAQVVRVAPQFMDILRGDNNSR